MQIPCDFVLPLWQMPLFVSCPFKSGLPSKDKSWRWIRTKSRCKHTKNILNHQINHDFSYNRRIELYQSKNRIVPKKRHIRNERRDPKTSPLVHSRSLRTSNAAYPSLHRNCTSASRPSASRSCCLPTCSSRRTTTASRYARRTLSAHHLDSSTARICL